MQSSTRHLTYADALVEASGQCMERDPNVIMFGLGINDPKRIFGTIGKLPEQFGKDRIFDVPLSENALTGIAIGAATMGMRTVLTHQRVDFAILSLDQIINNAAKWSYMFAGQYTCPIVIRMIIGRGWGQGPQHSQSLQALFAHIPGLKVVMPATAHDAKGLLAASIQDNNPVIFLEHRWLHKVSGPVPENYYEVPIGTAEVSRKGKDITIVGTSYMTYEAFRAAEKLSKHGFDPEVIDLRSIKPWDEKTILQSVAKTGRLLVCDTGHISFGVSAEIIATVTEKAFATLKCAPARIASPDLPVPTTPALAQYYYPRSSDIARQALAMLGAEGTPKALEIINELQNIESLIRSDVPDLNFNGPF